MIKTTEKKPTKSGWYWGLYRGKRWEVVDVIEDHNGALVADWGEGFGKLDSYTRWSIEPLEEPKMDSKIDQN